MGSGHTRVNWSNYHKGGTSRHLNLIFIRYLRNSWPRRGISLRNKLCNFASVTKYGIPHCFFFATTLASKLAGLTRGKVKSTTYAEHKPKKLGGHHTYIKNS